MTSIELNEDQTKSTNTPKKAPRARTYFQFDRAAYISINFSTSPHLQVYLLQCLISGSLHSFPTLLRKSSVLVPGGSRPEEPRKWHGAQLLFFGLPAAFRSPRARCHASGRGGGLGELGVELLCVHQAYAVLATRARSQAAQRRRSEVLKD